MWESAGADVAVGQYVVLPCGRRSRRRWLIERVEVFRGGSVDEAWALVRRADWKGRPVDPPRRRTVLVRKDGRDVLPRLSLTRTRKDGGS